MGDTQNIRIAAIYARRSRDDPARDSSIPDQIKRCQEIAQREGYRVPAVYIVQEDDISRTELYRDGLIRLRELARTKAVAAIITRDMERLSGDLQLSILIKKELEHHGVKLLFTDFTYENTPEGNFIFYMRGAYSELEHAKILQRLRWGMERRAREGKPILGTIPLGYRYQNGRLEIDEAEATVVKRIFDMYLQGLGTWLIAKQLTAENVLTKYDRDPKGHHKRRPVGVWSRSSIGVILRNRTYIGEMFWNKRKAVEPDPKNRRGPRNARRPKTAAEMRDPSEWFPIPVEPIIDREMFERVQAMMTHHKTRNRRRRKFEYLFLNGRLRCGFCGYGMSGYQDKGTRWYRCTGQRSNVQSRCKTRVKSDVIEEKVWVPIAANIIDVDAQTFRFIMEDRLREQTQHDHSHEDLETVQKKIEECNRKLSRYLGDYSNEKLDADDYGTLKAKINGERQSLEQIKTQIEQRRALIHQNTERIQTAMSYIEYLQSSPQPYSIQEKRKILEGVNVYVVYRDREHQRIFFDLPTSIDLQGEDGDGNPIEADLPDEVRWRGPESIQAIQWGEENTTSIEVEGDG